MIRAHIEPSWVTEGYNVYLIDQQRDATYQIFPGVGENVNGARKEVQLNSSPLTPSFRLGPGELEALINAGSYHQKQDKALEDHLKDATTVRDRLLTLVESTHART